MKTESEIIEKLADSLDNNLDYTNKIINVSKFRTFEKNLLSFLKKHKENLSYQSWHGGDYHTLASTIQEYCEITNNNKQIEELISDKPYQIYHYSHYVTASRWSKDEDVILKNISVALEYACDVIQDRWEKLDNLLIAQKNPTSDIIRYFDCWKTKERWKEAEPILFASVDNTTDLRNYCEMLNQRIPEVEKILLNKIDDATDYIMHFKFRWPEYEKKIAKKPKRIFNYAKGVIGGRLPDELHNRMLMNKMSGDYASDAYFDYLSEIEQHTLNYLRSLDNEQRAELLRKI